MKDDYSANSRSLIYSWENVLFELGSERVKMHGNDALANLEHQGNVHARLPCQS